MIIYSFDQIVGQSAPSLAIVEEMAKEKGIDKFWISETGKSVQYMKFDGKFRKIQEAQS